MSMHRPVLYQEIIHALYPHAGGLYVDGTVGAGGHARGILEASRPDGYLLGLDVDPQALALARGQLDEFGQRAILKRASYTTLKEHLALLQWQAVDGIVLDLGVSTMQLETPGRGFSFLSDAPLDMRFDPDQRLKATDLVNELAEAELAEILWKYGEERKSRQVARAIVRSRPINTTYELARAVSGVTGSGRPGMHPATRTFQALRIAVNRELEVVEAALPQMVECLASGGRLAIIAFHSLEDRLVKEFIRRESRDCLCPPRQPICNCGHRAVLRAVTRKPIRPSVEETSVNPRARSARLRVAERI